MNINRVESFVGDGVGKVLYDTKPTEAQRDSEETASVKTESVKPFPEAAWRGIFAEYRRIMTSATEASDTFHFAALWARCAVALGRQVRFSYGMQLFPNVYLVCFGPTGDRKTTATRRGTELGENFKIIRGGGSGEGMADEFGSAEPGNGFLVYSEEFSSILRPGKWDGATLIPFLTQCFDCPDRYEMKFRKSPVSLDRPTPSLLAGATPDWFWADFHTRDFQGGFGNRLFFVTGPRKSAMALPEAPVLDGISRAVDGLAAIAPCEARLTPQASELWHAFYRAWDATESKRDALTVAAVRRIPSYALKLAMTYAALERTLPQIELDQLAAAIQVARYGEWCARELLALQNAGSNPRKELERRILAFVSRQPGKSASKREIYRNLHRHYRDAEEFNRAFDSLRRAGELFEATIGRTISVSLEPI
jgi:hypothetical protein